MRYLSCVAAHWCHSARAHMLTTSDEQTIHSIHIVRTHFDHIKNITKRSLVIHERKRRRRRRRRHNDNWRRRYANALTNFCHLFVRHSAKRFSSLFFASYASVPERKWKMETNLNKLWLAARISRLMWRSRYTFCHDQIRYLAVIVYSPAMRLHKNVCHKRLTARGPGAVALLGIS